MTKSAYCPPRYWEYPSTPCPNARLLLLSWLPPANAAANRKVPRSKESCAAVRSYSQGEIGAKLGSVGEVRKFGFIPKMCLSECGTAFVVSGEALPSGVDWQGATGAKK